MFIIAIVMSLLSAGCVSTVIQDEAGPAGKGRIILTFDDGPNPEVTDRLLDVLDNHKVRAVFCFIGRHVDENTGLAKRVFDHGHVIAGHSYEHRFPLFKSPGYHAREIENTEAALRKINEQYRMKYYRPPYGISGPLLRSVLSKKELQPAYITFYVNDVKTRPGEWGDVLEKIKREIVKHDGAAIVMHEGRFTNRPVKDASYDRRWVPEAVDDLILWAGEKGYTFATYDDFSP
jgi:peptidoglycan/xylan/chitin deacetylase (PgdA/CDA1 family)